MGFCTPFCVVWRANNIALIRKSGGFWKASAFLTLLALCVITIGENLPRWYWAADVLSSLRSYWIIGSVITALLFWLTGSRRWAGVALGLALINALPLWQLWQAPPIVPHGKPLTVLHLNIGRETTNRQPILNYVIEQQPDILFLQELTPTFSDQLTTTLPAYQVALTHPRWNTHGSALLTRKESGVRVDSAEIIHLPEQSDRPLLTATIEWENRPMTLLSLHTIRPGEQSRTLYQVKEFSAVAEWSARQTNALLIIGDFNATPWSDRFEKLLSIGRLHNTQAGFGWEGTWPANIPAPLRIPIDHAVSRYLVVLEHTIGRDLNSDHLPLLITVAHPLTP